jgi:V/A-type H+/Na+-transporting ATPase subunit D
LAKINPNRMEMLKLRRRAQMAKRGHKLLKDKLDELLRRFMALIDRANEARSRMETDLAGAFGLLALARGEAGTTVIAEALAGTGQATEVRVDVQSLLSVKVPTFTVPEVSVSLKYSLATTPAVLDSAVLDFESLLHRLVELAQIEKTIQLLALEIDATRRRVNALEHILIPQLETSIKWINMSLAEQERANLTRVMKIKEMLEAR